MHPHLTDGFPRARRLCAALLFALGLVAAADGQTELWVSGYTSQTVHRFDIDTGQFLGDLGSIPGAQSIRYGPDGDVYVCAEVAAQVLRFDGTTAAPLGPFVWDDPATPGDDTGGLTNPTAAVFGPDGNLYVASFDGDNVLRYDGTTGAYMDVFVSAGDGNLNGPDAGMTFGPDGHLYVPSFNNNRVLRFDGSSGAFIDAFVAPGEGLTSRPRALRFRSDGWLYVSSWGNSRILRFDRDGDFVDPLVNSSAPRVTGFAFLASGDIVATSDANDFVRLYDGTSGDLLQTLVAPGGGGLDAGTWVETFPDTALRLGRIVPGVAGAPNSITVRGATPSTRVLLSVGSQTATAPILSCAGSLSGVAQPLRRRLYRSDANGEFTASLPLGPAFAGRTVVVQALETSTCRVSNLVVQVIQ